MPTAFIAGATGYTGLALIDALAGRQGWTARPHARKEGKLHGAVVCDPHDVAALAGAMGGCEAVVQLIGTVRARFDEGDYDAVDYGTTVALGEAALAARVPRFILLSSVGAGSARGRYLRAKRKTEAWVEASGLEYTLVRPSFIVGPGRRAAQLLGALAYPIPSLRAIEVHELARLFVRVLERPEAVKNRIIEGRALWALLR